MFDAHLDHREMLDRYAAVGLDDVIVGLVPRNLAALDRLGRAVARYAG